MTEREIMIIDVLTASEADLQDVLAKYLGVARPTVKDMIDWRTWRQMYTDGKINECLRPVSKKAQQVRRRRNNSSSTKPGKRSRVLLPSQIANAMIETQERVKEMDDDIT